MRPEGDGWSVSATQLIGENNFFFEAPQYFACWKNDEIQLFSTYPLIIQCLTTTRIINKYFLGLEHCWESGALVPKTVERLGGCLSDDFTCKAANREGRGANSCFINDADARRKSIALIDLKPPSLPDSAAPPSGLSGVTSAAACRRGRKSEVCAAAA